MTESEAVALVRAEGRRLLVLGGGALLVAMLVYVAVNILWLERPVSQALTRAVPLLLVVALLAYLFQVPRWARGRRTPVTRASVGQVTQDEITLQGGPHSEVSVMLPRGTSGFRRGDRVWVCPDLAPAQMMAVVVPAHVTSPRPVISARAVPTRR